MEFIKIGLTIIQIITPFIIVGIVYSIWHRQKGKEVIAGEAKEILFRVSKVISLSSNILDTIYDLPKKANQKIFDEQINLLKATIDELRHSLIFISEATNDEDLTDLQAEYWYNCMQTVQEYSLLYKKAQTNSPDGNSDELIEVHNRIIHNSTNIKNRLYKIATFQD